MVSDPGPIADAGPPIRAVYRLEPREFMAANRVLARQSKITVGLGLVLTALGVVNLVFGVIAPDPVSIVTGTVVPVIFGLGLVSGWYCVPFCWLSMRKRPDLFGAETTVEIDRSGLHFATAMYDSRVAWSFVRRVRDLGAFLFFDSGAFQSLFLPKRALGDASLSVLRSVLVDRGLTPA